jgi:hypothetical protein
MYNFKFSPFFSTVIISPENEERVKKRAKLAEKITAFFKGIFKR